LLKNKRYENEIDNCTTVFVLGSFCTNKLATIKWPYGCHVAQSIAHNGAVYITTNDGQAIGSIYKTINQGMLE
jgi:hypothetical protein